MSNIFIHQIFYNEATKGLLEPGFIPLDNQKNERPDWFEFWVILNFLRNTPLQDNAWYGFVSPKFREKTGLQASVVIKAVKSHGHLADVVLMSPSWDQIAYYLNPWEQGDAWHPGLTAMSQYFLNQVGIAVDLRTLVTDSDTSVYSNYIVAKKDFWMKWLALAEKLFAMFENSNTDLCQFPENTSYGSKDFQYPMKTFIQERLATLILATGRYKTLKFNQTLNAPMLKPMFGTSATNLRLLQTCELLKAKYREKSDPAYLEMYWKIRQDVQYTPPRH